MEKREEKRSPVAWYISSLIFVGVGLGGSELAATVSEGLDLVVDGAAVPGRYRFLSGGSGTSSWVSTLRHVLQLTAVATKEAGWSMEKANCIQWMVPGWTFWLASRSRSFSSARCWRSSVE